MRLEKMEKKDRLRPYLIVTYIGEHPDIEIRKLSPKFSRELAIRCNKDKLPVEALQRSEGGLEYTDELNWKQVRPNYDSSICDNNDDETHTILMYNGGWQATNDFNEKELQIIGKNMVSMFKEEGLLAIYSITYYARHDYRIFRK